MHTIYPLHSIRELDTLTTASTTASSTPYTQDSDRLSVATLSSSIANLEDFEETAIQTPSQSSSAEVPIILSQTLQNPNLDSPARIEILRREHIGSRDHPHGCRPCHFQGGLCWKGLSCTFCHICPKPVRKSKHQRDVDRRRAERYRQVRDDLGIECLNSLTNIDDMRRNLMCQSEEAKTIIKNYSQQVDCNDRLEQYDSLMKLFKEMKSEFNFSLVRCIEEAEKINVFYPKAITNQENLTFVLNFRATNNMFSKTGLNINRNNLENTLKFLYTPLDGFNIDDIRTGNKIIISKIVQGKPLFEKNPNYSSISLDSLD